MNPRRLFRRRPPDDLADPNFIGFDKYRRHGAYHWKELETNDRYRAKIELVTRLASPTSACIDLGCGDGAYAYYLSRRCASVTGVDADGAAIQVGRKKLRSAGVDNVELVHAPISAVAGLIPGPFDLVYSMDVIEHLPQPRELLHVMVAVAAPSATVVVGTPLFLSPELVSPYHVKEFERDEIRGLLDEYIEVTDEHVIAEDRRDGRVHDSFYVAVGRPRAST